MAITLKDESILNEWAEMIEGASGQGGALLDGIEARLRKAQIPGDCKWSLQEVKSAGLFSRVRREFLIVTTDEFKDYRIYISARDYGIYLEVSRFMTVEPGFLKGLVSSAITEKLGGQGDAATLSGPKNILRHQDLTAWGSVVHYAVVDAVSSLMEELGQDPSKLNRESKGFLDLW